jgi:hypothetical protein
MTAAYPLDCLFQFVEFASINREHAGIYLNVSLTLDLMAMQTRRAYHSFHGFESRERLRQLVRVTDGITDKS